jgi:tRNA uridine 5-carboxymethylaminomethyl modification enzyme
MQEILLNTKNLSIIAKGVNDIVLIEQPNSKFKVSGVVLENGQTIDCKSIIITTGTFLRANINIGLESRPAGRLGDKPSVELACSIEKIGFQMGRLKTGNFYNCIVILLKARKNVK